MYTVTTNSHRQHMADEIRTADTLRLPTVSVETTTKYDCLSLWPLLRHRLPSPNATKVLIKDHIYKIFTETF